MNLSRIIQLCVAATCLVSCSSGTPAFEAGVFADPPMQYRPAPLWFWNDTEVDADTLSYQLRQMVERDGYGGCAITPFGRGFRPDYLSDEYMDIYARVVETADSLGAHMSLYDEYGFPSGSMGFSNADGIARFQIAHPDHTIRRLDRHDTPVSCGSTVELDLSGLQGKLMAVAAYNSISEESRSLRSAVRDSLLTWTAPDEGSWTVMVFECLIDGKPRLNYLDKEGAALFVQDVHEKYYARLGDRFGSVITSTFFDEPTMYYGEGRMWSDDFNDRFVELYGIEPDAFYPALWFEIGEKTAAARNMMYATHTSLYAEAFTKTIADWAESHGIPSTGHQDQEEIANTTGTCGDLMLHGRYMSIPGIDKIGGDRPAELFYKVVSSSANNWDKTEVMSETYGAMGNIPVSELYRIAIEQYTKGITNLIPHAVWYDDSNVTFPPELSWRNPLYNSELPSFNKFLARLRYAFARPARHIADIAVLYPVQTQYAGHRFDGGLGPVRGSVEVEGTDYPEVSRILTDELGQDFTYLHPSVLDDRCNSRKGFLRMANKVNSEKFSVLILPGVKAISLSNMKQVMKAWKKGVKIVFTTQLPCLSADYGVSNEEIAEMVGKMLTGSKGSRSAVFVENPTPESLAAALSGMSKDVDFLSETEPFNYIHKQTDGQEIYLFGNIDSESREQQISLRGSCRRLLILDPASGAESEAEAVISGGRTVFNLSLDPAEARLAIAYR